MALQLTRGRPASDKCLLRNNVMRADSRSGPRGRFGETFMRGTAAGRRACRPDAPCACCVVVSSEPYFSRAMPIVNCALLNAGADAATFPDFASYSMPLTVKAEPATTLFIA